MVRHKVTLPAGRSQQQNATQQDFSAKGVQPIFADSRPEFAQLKEAQAFMATSPHHQNLLAQQTVMANSSRSQSLLSSQPNATVGNLAQCRVADGIAAPAAQLVDDDDLQPSEFIAEPAQRNVVESTLESCQETSTSNSTGLPNQLKAGIESLSGLSMDHVKVHYNSNKPAQLQAHAYAQGSDIHVAPGQENHLPHEAWHVVQQAQGRVEPTMQMKGDTSVNDDVGLESEADEMGVRALERGAAQRIADDANSAKSAFGFSIEKQSNSPRSSAVQRKPIDGLSAGQAVTEDNKVWIGDSTATAKRYWTVAAANSASRAELLKSIAALGGTLGQEIDAKVHKWNFNPDLLGKESNFYDPLMVRISGTYNGGTLAVDYHFGSGFAGYIIRVDDNGEVKTMVGRNGVATDDAYSSVHDVGVDVGPLAGGSADAVTKVTGEGARWQAVRNAASYIQDGSRFYTNENAGNTLTVNVRHVDFPVLWKSWDATFKKGYNITDARIVRELINENLRVTTAEGVIDSKVNRCLSAQMTHGQDVCVDLVKPTSQAELLPKTIAFYRFTLDTPISGARGKSYDDQVEAVTNRVTSLDGVTYRGIGGSTCQRRFKTDTVFVVPAI